MNKLKTITGMAWIGAGFVFIATGIADNEFIMLPLGIIHLGIGHLYLFKVDS